MGTVEIILEISKRVAELEKENEWLREDLKRKEEELSRSETQIWNLNEINSCNTKWGERRESEAIKYKALFLQANAAKRHYRRTAWDELNNNFSYAMKQDTCKHEGKGIIFSTKGHIYCRECRKQLTE